MRCIDPIYYSREDNLVPVSYDTHKSNMPVCKQMEKKILRNIHTRLGPFFLSAT